jgi:hypothetical protein
MKGSQARILYERASVMSNHSRESWPGLSRPSTSCSLNARKKDVDARDKRGHDGGKVFGRIGTLSS